MSVTTEHTAAVILAREREDRSRHKQLVARVMQSEQCKYVIRGSKGDLLGCRWHFCRLKEGHTGLHKDPYNRDFRSDLHVHSIRKGQMPCAFVTPREYTPWDRRHYAHCNRIEGHFGRHCDESDGPFRSSVLDIDVFTYPGRWPVRTEPFPPTVMSKHASEGVFQMNDDETAGWSATGKRVECKNCHRVYKCTSDSDYYNSTCATDGLCETCVVRLHSTGLVSGLDSSIAGCYLRFSVPGKDRTFIGAPLMFLPGRYQQRVI